MRVWTNANVTESFPGVTTPLTYSFARYFYRVIFRDCYRRLGIGADRLHGEHESLDRMIGFLEGRIYYCLSSFYRLHSQSPLFPIFRGHWEKMMGFRASYQTQPESLFERVLGTTRKGAEVSAASTMLLYRYATHERELGAFHSWWEATIAPLRGKSFDDEDPIVTIGEFHRVWREVGERWGVTLLNDTYLPLLYGTLEKLFASWGLQEDKSLLGDLLCGDDGMRSVEIIESAIRLAEMVRRDPDLVATFRGREPAALWRAIQRGEVTHDFCAAVARHLHAYGDRGLQELKMEQPNLRDTPEVLIQNVRAYVESGVTVRAARDVERRTREDAERRLARAVSPLRYRLASPLLAAVRRLIKNRENSRYCRSELFGFSKKVFHGLGSQLVKRGVLARADDVVFLTQDEVFGWFDGTGVTHDMAALATIRRREAERHEAANPPMDLTTMGAVPDHGLTAGDAPACSGDLRGLGSSTGRARGRARVIVDPRTAGALGDDAILIARETDPGWLFLMLACKGIVVERGSMLSHTAITGRKFGIPTVVSVPQATTRIPNGAWIEIDGASGTVTILDQAAE
jgi:pyruvate,water dikinase